MKQLNRMEVPLVGQNRTAKWTVRAGWQECLFCVPLFYNPSQPDFKTFFRIAEVLNVDVRELLHVEKQSDSTDFQ